MSFEHKLTWLWAAVAVAGPVGYYATVLWQLPGTAVDEIAYRPPMLFSIAAMVTVFGIGYLVIWTTAPKNIARSDERDIDIDRRGQIAAGNLVTCGAAAALLLAVADVDQFWIANAVYLAFALAGLVLAAVKLTGYHGSH